MTTAGDVLSYHDGSLQGANTNEAQLSPVNVTSATFGKLYATNVDGQVYAEPLTVSGVTIASGPNTVAGAAGVHNVVFVATEHDSIYAIDSASGVVLWQRSFLNTAVAANNPLNATAITTVPYSDTGSGDLAPEIGITGTPVIDGATNTMYVVVKTKETIGGTPYDVQRLHAINIGDGTDVVSPFLIGDTTNGNTNNTPIYVYGNGDGAVTDPYSNTGKQVVQFNALHEAQRQAINLVNGKVYVAWASHGDIGPYHGLVAAWDVSNLTTTGFKLAGVLDATPNGGLGGIWGGGGQLAFEPNGGAFYFETGNGPSGHGNPILNAAGFPVDGDYYEALVKVVADPTTSPTNQNVNGWGFKVADYFIPYNQVALDNADEDFGSSSPMILPPSAGIPGHPDLMIASGKEGKLYVIDRDNMGKFSPTNDNVLNAIPNGLGSNTPPVQISGALSTAAYFNGTVYYTSGYSGTSNAYTINANGTLTQTSQTPETSFGYLPGSVSVSADGAGNGIVWVMDRNSNEIHAYNATSMATELWNSGQVSTDAVGAVTKFGVPTVSHGEVFVGTSSNTLVVYGLTKAAGQAPVAPVLKATALSGTTVNLTWTDVSIAPNLADSYLVEESTDGTNYNPIATAPGGTAALAIGGLNAGTTYEFRIRGKNNAGISTYSNIATATTTNQVAALNFSNGFTAATSSLTLNGSTTLNGTKLELTNGRNYEVSSAFSTAPVDVTKFSTQFTFQITNPTADGFTFAIQGQGPTAIGGTGGGLGYATDGNTSGPKITKSVAIKFDLWNNAGEGVNSTGLYTNGADPTNVGSIDLSSTGINLHSGDPFLVNMSYDGTTLSVTITDDGTGQSATQSYVVNIPGTVGGSTGYVGFTAATGGSSATQDILNWTFTPTSAAAQAPNAPSALGAVPATATSINLSWTANATNQTGYLLDRATDSGFTQNVVTQTLPPTPTSFTDSVAGLAPGSTYYYRLRAINAGGPSANSNVVQVTIPLAPPQPSNLQVVGVTTSEVDLTWVDNASTKAHAYLILRSAAGGPFIQYATLPATSDVPGSTYAWSDKNITPGTAYGYHIEDVNSSGNNDFIGTSLVTIPLPPTGLTATPAATSVTLSWGAVTGAIQYNVYRGTANTPAGSTPITTITSGTAYTDTGLTPGVTYVYTVTAVNANLVRNPVLPAESAASALIAVTIPALPTPWVSQDVGAPAIAGNATDASNVFTISGSGSGVRQTSDQYQFVSQAVSGDTTVVARLVSQTGSDGWAKSAVMIRSTNSATSPYLALSQTVGNGISFEARQASGGYALYTENGPVVKGPVYLKIVGSGNSYTGSYSTDGVNYTTIGTYTVSLGTSTLAGLAVTSHNMGLVNTATIDNVSVAPTSTSSGTSLPTGWVGSDIGAPGVTGSASYNSNSGVFTVTGGGANIGNTSDQFQYADVAVSADFTMIARVASQQNTNPWAKAGIMVRATSAANSAYAFLFNTPGNGTVFQSRATTGATHASVSGPVLSGAVFLKLQRVGSTLTGYVSTDGVNWTTVFSYNLSLANNVFVGLAVTSHDNATASTATFDSVSITNP